MAIAGFRHKGLEELLVRGRSRRINAQVRSRLLRMLDALHQATTIEDCAAALPGFHALSGDMAGRYSARVTGNYRLTFDWRNGDAVDVDFEDYH